MLWTCSWNFQDPDETNTFERRGGWASQNQKNADTSEKQTCVRQNSETLVSFPHRAQSAVKVAKF